MVIKPYIGVTGAASCEEVESIIQTFITVGYTMTTSHIPMLGFLVSADNLEKPDIPFGNRYPRFNSVVDLLKQTKGRALTMIHYRPSQEPSVRLSLAAEVIQIFESTNIYAQGLCKSVQFNTAWPDGMQVRAIKAKYPDMQIVLQLRREMMAGRLYKDVVKEIKEKYGKCLSYVLVDPSAGEGKEFKVKESTIFYREIKEQIPDLVVGFAGGLAGKDCEGKLRGIVRDLEGRVDFCIDSESGFRDKQTDTLEIERVKKHLQEVARVLP